MSVREQKLDPIECPRCDGSNFGRYRGRKQQREGIRITEHKVWKCDSCNKLVWGKGKLVQIENDYVKMYREAMKPTRKGKPEMTNVTEESVENFDATLEEFTHAERVGGDEALQGSRSDAIDIAKQRHASAITAITDARFAKVVRICVLENPDSVSTQRAEECNLPDDYVGRPDPWAWANVNGFKSSLTLSDEVIANEWATEIVNRRSLLLMRTAAAKIRQIFAKDLNNRLTFPRGERVWYNDTLIFLHAVYQPAPKNEDGSVSTWEDLGVDEGDVHPHNSELALRYFEFFCTDDHRGYKVCEKIAARDWSFRAVDVEARHRQYAEVNRLQGIVWGLEQGDQTRDVLDDGMVEGKSLHQDVLDEAF